MAMSLELKLGVTNTDDIFINMDEMFWGKSKIEKRKDFRGMLVFQGCKEQAKESEKGLGREERKQDHSEEGEEGALGRVWFMVFSAIEK